MHFPKQTTSRNQKSAFRVQGYMYHFDLMLEEIVKTTLAPESNI
jgi:hypothetical protein